MTRIRSSNRQDAKERRMERRYWDHIARGGNICFVERRASYIKAVQECRECRKLPYPAVYFYHQGNWAVVQLLPKRREGRP